MTPSSPRESYFLIIFAFLLIGFSSFYTLVVPKYGYLKCDRSNNKCNFESGSLWQAQKKEFLIVELKGATIDAQSSKDRFRKVYMVYRVVLLPDHTNLIESYWIGSYPQQIANEINAFIKSPQQRSLQVSQDERHFGVTVGICFIVIGIYILVIHIINLKT